MSVCAYEFVPGEAVDVDLSGPHGWVWNGRQVTDEVGAATWELDSLPMPIAGDYVLRGFQGQVEIATPVPVRFESLDAGVIPDEVSIGQTLRLVVAGGPSDTSVPAYLYFALPDQYRFTADLGPVALDGNGEGAMALTPRSGDPPGNYMIIVPWPPGAENTDEHEFVVH
jgi:hypothetical protein